MTRDCRIIDLGFEIKTFRTTFPTRDAQTHDTLGIAKTRNLTLNGFHYYLIQLLHTKDWGHLLRLLDHLICFCIWY